MRRGLRLFGAAAAAACLITPAAARASPTVLAAQRAPTSVSAYGELAVWSSWDADARVYRLAASQSGGPPSVLAARPRPVPFDVDVGPGPNGSPVAVYSRCRRSPPAAGARGAQVNLPAYARGRRCDVWRYDFATGAERRVPGASARRVSEYLPSIWRDRLVFARIDSRRPRARGVQPHLALLRLGSGKRLRPIRGGRTGFYDFPDPRRNSALGGPGLTGIDLYGERLAFTWDSVAETCRTKPDRPVKSAPSVSELWLVDLGGDRRRLARGCSFDRVNFLQSPSFAAGRLAWVTALQPDSSAPPRRFDTLDLATGQVTSAPAPSCLSSMVRGSDAIYAARLVDCPDGQGDPSRAFEVTRDP